MGQRVTKLEGRVAADARQTRLYAEKLTQQLHQQITAEMDARTSTLDARLRQVESEQADQRAQMARVEANLKQDISAVREENGRDLSGVRQQEESNARDVSAMSQKLDRRRIDFEITKGQNQRAGSRHLAATSRNERFASALPRRANAGTGPPDGVVAGSKCG